MWGICGVGESRWGNRGVGELWFGGVVVCGSHGVGELHCGGVAVCGGQGGYQSLINCVFGVL